MKKLLVFILFISTSLQAAVSCLYSVANLVRQDHEWFQVAIPTERGFEFQEVSDPVQAQKLVSSVTESQRVKIEDSLNEVADHYQSVVASLKSIAVSKQSELQFRLKDPESIRNKIIDRARSYSHQGRIFQIKDLHDLAGGRLIVELNSQLYNLNKNKEIWSQLLGISQDQILEIEIKGDQTDQTKGKYYRAVHLIIAHESGVRFELQVLSKAVKHWHKWDHSHVYKNTNSNKQYQEYLRLYSKAWIQTIRLLEDLKLEPNSKKLKTQLAELHSDLNIDFTWSNWAVILDNKLAGLFDISYNDRFLVESYQNKPLRVPTINRKAIKDLGNLTLIH